MSDSKNKKMALCRHFKHMNEKPHNVPLNARQYRQVINHELRDHHFVFMNPSDEVLVLALFEKGEVVSTVQLTCREATDLLRSQNDYNEATTTLNFAHGTITAPTHALNAFIRKNG